MTWDGTAVTGLINPGPDAVPLGNVAVDWGDWAVRIEAEAKDATGRTDIAADGRLDRIGSSRRTLTGTWTQGSRTGEVARSRGRGAAGGGGQRPRAPG